MKKFRKNGLSDELQLRFLQRLQRTLANGYPLLEALDTIRWDRRLANTAVQIIDMLKRGLALDEALEQTKFHPSICSYLHLSRNIGNVAESLDKCIEMFQKRCEYLRKFQQLSRYPLLLIIVFSLLLFFIKKNVLPAFLDLFQTSSQASTTVTVSLFVIDFLMNLTVVASILGISGILFWKYGENRISIETRIRFYRSLPIYRVYLRMNTSFQFASHLSSMLKTGMTLKDILTSLSNQRKYPVISHYSSILTAEVSKGMQVHQILPGLYFLDDQLTFIFHRHADMLALEKDLAVYTDFLVEDLHRKIIKAITMIQPIFFIVLALLIIFIYVSLMWPMFQLIQSI
ncbi:type II secretion system F family protein [Virgibacillus halophilus]